MFIKSTKKINQIIKYYNLITYVTEALLEFFFQTIDIIVVTWVDDVQKLNNLQYNIKVFYMDST